ncbi:thioredoxin domain-containing protein [Mariniphaga sediminis]|uniref:thioredoxin domain-containing protein n=1 Tax=Mariniphaga sediminis TaxID=1628158 RepID=UPI003561A4EE
MEQHTNALVHSTSPYLLQHAHNPVNWYPWDESRIKKAQEENKLLLVSIGYSACHWCHVMEHESFEDEQVARVMNEHFVCIKVDREERPDVDQYYMTAVHLMGRQGGWPLNVIALPDGRPVWGGTYFPKETWINNILAVYRFWNENREKTLEYAQNLQEGIGQVSFPGVVENEIPVESSLINRGVDSWKEHFDSENGGREGYPKFPMPVNLDFLLYYGFITKDKKVLDFINLTLVKMARGGIYDQAGGGFARYSVDDKWKVPHFEKMLYDNGQLLSVYSRGYQLFKEEEYKSVVYETVRFIEQDLMDETGAFYSSLDADSEGEEGKFYVWKSSDLKDFLNEDFDLFARYFNINSKGFWEQGNYILLRDNSDSDFARENGLTLAELKEKVGYWKKLLLKARSKRVRPGLDDKTLASWNALVIQGLADAYKAFGDEKFKTLAWKNARFLVENMMDPDGALFHSWKQGRKSVDGFLEDYALVIRAFISLFEISGQQDWLHTAEQLVEDSFNRFYNKESGLFWFSSKEKESVTTNFFQLEDNVIPAANSVMANNLHKLYLMLGKSEYLSVVQKMLQHITPQFSKYPQAFANWGKLMLKLTTSYFEIAICGEDAEKRFLEMQTDFHPNVLWAFSHGKSKVPLLEGRYVKNKTLIYVCRDGSCQLPVEEVDLAINQLVG